MFLIRCHAAGDGNDQVNHENNRVNDNYKKDFSHFSLVQLENALVSCLNLKRERERQKRASRKVRKGEGERMSKHFGCCGGQKRIGSFGKYVNKI